VSMHEPQRPSKKTQYSTLEAVSKAKFVAYDLCWYSRHELHTLNPSLCMVDSGTADVNYTPQIPRKKDCVSAIRNPDENRVTIGRGPRLAPRDQNPAKPNQTKPNQIKSNQRYALEHELLGLGSCFLGRV
jgi:hypothetical protein